MLIALSGYGGAGKDSVADILVNDYGFKRFAWADTLRLASSILNPVVGVYLDGQLVTGSSATVAKWAEESSVRIVRYNDALVEDGYVEAKAKYSELRQFLQLLGTEVGRNLISDTVWVDATLNRISRECGPGDSVVITDTRFENEAIAVSMADGHLVRVERPGVGPVNNHPSETSLDNYPHDYVFKNVGGLEDLPEGVANMLQALRN